MKGVTAQNTFNTLCQCKKFDSILGLIQSVFLEDIVPVGNLQIMYL